MKGYKTANDFFSNATNFKDVLLELRTIFKSIPQLTETIKWGTATYTYKNKNIAGIGAFKSYAGIWFFQGVLLKDKKSVLINAQKDKTKALRQWRFSSVKELEHAQIKAYLYEAIELVNQGKEIKPTKNKPLVVPQELGIAFEKNNELKQAFNSLSLTKQREHTEHISSAKQDKTKQRRLEKCIDLILTGKGLNDKYR